MSTAASPFYRSLLYYSAGMGLYGTTRGYRSNELYDPKEKKWIKGQRLIGTRLIDSVFTGAIYALPPCSLFETVHLINRIHIRYMGWNSEDFPKEYEGFGYQTYCRDTI